MRTRNCRRRCYAGALVIVVLIVTPTFGAAQRATVGRDTDQQVIAKLLLSDNEQERDGAFNAARHIGPSASGPVLRAALIALLAKQNQLVRKAERDGIPVDLIENPEFIVEVQEVVAALREPAAIPALAQALGTFATVRALAAFGEQAVPDVVGVVRSAEIDHSAIDDGLIVLRWIVEHRGVSALSDNTIAQIRQAAEERLAGEQSFTTLWYAMDLAAALDDAQLRGIISGLAINPPDVVARGVTDPRLVEKTQQRARGLLAGVPALPRPQF